MTTQTIELQEVSIMHEGIIYLVTKNNKVQNTETSGYIRKAELVSAILEKAEAIRNSKNEYEAKKASRIEAYKQANAEKREQMKEQRQLAKLQPKEVKEVVKPTINDTIRTQLAYEFLILNKSIKELEKETHALASEVLFTELGLSEDNKGNFAFMKTKTIIGTLKRYGKETLVSLLENKFYAKTKSDKYGMKVS